MRRIQADHTQQVQGQSLQARALAPETEQNRPDLAHLYRSMNRLNPKRPRTFLARSPGLTRWRGSSTALLAISGVPVLFLVGEHDMIVPARAIRAAQEALPGSRYVEIAHAGHPVYFEQPAAFNRAVRTFLADAWPVAGHAAPK